MQNFTISRYVSIQPVDGYTDEIPEKYQDAYVLYDERKDKDYLINSTIKYYIEKYTTPQTQAGALASIEAEVGSKSEQLTQTCEAFFAFLLKGKILVEAGIPEPEISSDNALAIGETIDEFVIGQLVSGRRYTDVYLAKKYGDETSYIIKYLNKHKTANPTYYQKELDDMRKEYALLKDVAHIPAMCSAYHFVQHNDCAYIVLEYIKGKSLLHHVEENMTMGMHRCYTLIENMLTAFASLHQHHIVHGDIHSSNLLVSNDGQVKIIDLGMSKKLTTQNNEVVKFGGVNFYMPPERIAGTSRGKYIKEADLLSDVYQLGILMYLALYQTFPFEGFVWEELAHNIKQSEPAFPGLSVYKEIVPEKLIMVIRQCLSKEPGARQANAGVILSDFKKAVFTECIAIK